MTTDEPPPRPPLRVVSGDPTADELAALVAVLAARAAAGSASGSGPGPTSAWCDRAALMRRPLPHGQGSWRAWAWPR